MLLARAPCLRVVATCGLAWGLADCTDLPTADAGAPDAATDDGGADDGEPPDGGAESDAGNTPDAGEGGDAGGLADGGFVDDGGQTVDGGGPQSCAVDAGPIGASGSQPDAFMFHQADVAQFAAATHPPGGYFVLQIGDLVGGDGSDPISDLSPLRDVTFRVRLLQVDAMRLATQDLTLLQATITDGVDITATLLEEVHIEKARTLLGMNVNGNSRLTSFRLPDLVAAQNINLRNNPSLCDVDLGGARACPDDERVFNASCTSGVLTLTSCCP